MVPPCFIFHILHGKYLTAVSCVSLEIRRLLIMKIISDNYRLVATIRNKSKKRYVDILCSSGFSVTVSDRDLPATTVKRWLLHIWLSPLFSMSQAMVRRFLPHTQKYSLLYFVRWKPTATCLGRNVWQLVKIGNRVFTVYTQVAHGAL